MFECGIYPYVGDGVDGGDDGNEFEAEEESALPALVVCQFAVEVGEEATEGDDPKNILRRNGNQTGDAFEVLVRNRDRNFREDEHDGEGGKDGGYGGKHELRGVL